MLFNFSSLHLPKNNLYVIIQKKTLNSIKLKIENKDLFFSEKLIRDSVNFNDLIYKLTLKDYGPIREIIKKKEIPKEVQLNKIKIIQIDYKMELEFTISDLDSFNCYEILIEAVDKTSNHSNNSNKQKVYATSNEIIANTKYEMTEFFDSARNFVYKINKSILCKSEKELVDKVINRNEIPHGLSEKEVKKFVFESRNHTNTKDFINSKYKFSKRMTEERKNKIVFSTNTEIIFNEKFKDKDKNPFMKNEWFMGGIYAYDYNYEDLQNK